MTNLRYALVALALVAIVNIVVALTGTPYAFVMLTRGGPHKDIREYGAVGDGVVTFGVGATGTDNSTAIAAAFSASTSVFIPPGTFVTNSPIYLPGDYSCLRGSGINNSLIVYTGTDAAIIASFPNTGVGTDYAEYIEISGLTIICSNVTATQVAGLKLKTVKSFRASNVFIAANVASPTSGTVGVDITDSFVLQFDHVFLKYWDKGMFTYTHTTGYAGDLVFSGQGEVQNNNYGLYIGDPDDALLGGNFSIKDCTIEGNYVAGIAINNEIGHTIDSNWFEANTCDIYVGLAGTGGAPQNIAIRRNRLGASSSITKVYLNRGTGIAFYDNRIIGKTGAGDGVSGSGQCAYVSFNNDIVTAAHIGLSQVATASTGIVYNFPGGKTGWTDVATFGDIRDASGTPTASFAAAVGYEEPSYRKLWDNQTNEIQLRGVLDGTGVGTFPCTLFTLPLGYRPAKRRQVRGYGWAGYILTTGEVGLTAQEYSLHSLDGISFDPDN